MPTARAMIALLMLLAGCCLDVPLGEGSSTGLPSGTSTGSVCGNPGYVCSEGFCVCDCLSDAGGECAPGLTCTFTRGLACTPSNPNCNGWHCVNE